MSDITETVTVQDGQAAVKTVAVSGTLSPEKSATDFITVVETPQGKHAAVKVVNIGGGSSGGDFLPTTGGEMTGLLTLNAEKTESAYDYGTLLKAHSETEDGSKKKTLNIGMKPDGGLYFDGATLAGLGDIVSKNKSNMGNSLYKWGTIYATALYGTGTLNIPSGSGTLARLEDIQEAIGTIETALAEV